jgi:hypothetical protein
LKCEDWERRKELGAMPAGLERQLRAFIALPFRSLEDISLRERPGFRIEIVDRVARQPKNLGHQRIKLLCWMHLGAEPFEILTAYVFMTASAKMLRAVLRLDRKGACRA